MENNTTNTNTNDNDNYTSNNDNNQIKNVVFLEYTVATGVPDENLLNEGKLMFDTLLNQFLNSDSKYNVTCFLDENIYKKYAKDYNMINKSSQNRLNIVITHNTWLKSEKDEKDEKESLISDYKEKLAEILRKHNEKNIRNYGNYKNRKIETAGFVIGPENDGKLAQLTKIIEDNEAILNIGCSSEGVMIAGDKYLTYLAIKDKVPTPNTLPIKKYIIKENLGCDGIHEVIGDNLIVQEYFEGVPYSYVFIVSSNSKNLNNSSDKYELYPICMNKQYITDCYCGGEININHKLKEKAKELCAETLQCINGLNGYIGVDFMINEETEEITIIEVNPRITTSIHGINTEPPLCDLLIENVSNNNKMSNDKLNYKINTGLKFYRDGRGFKFEELE
ncbi:ATP-grasp domain-containing protein [Methanococcus voltae]|uniref:ATP-grasp domain-containing protein n=1 Tax=Methanococcus voltae TaxID=2188 RepID=UPI001AE9FF16|nr:ATP-grasp domain-containing protein [Methanococcus voltae]MBP2171824.1 putative ATP-grasp superfamily ATP-dependent carboligase [Methanococcus voltae]